MSVKLVFECDGCDAKAPGTAPMGVEFRSFSGKSHGFGNRVYRKMPPDLAPEGWMPYDPWTYCCYCPECWASILESSEESKPEMLE